MVLDNVLTSQSFVSVLRNTTGFVQPVMWNLNLHQSQGDDDDVTGNKQKQSV